MLLRADRRVSQVAGTGLAGMGSFWSAILTVVAQYPAKRRSHRAPLHPAA